MRRVGWIDAAEFAQHRGSPGHPERPERLDALRAGMAKRGIDGLVEHARPTPVDRALLHSVHTPDYVTAVERLCQKGGGRLDPDTSVVPESWQAALLATGAVVDAVQRVMDGRWLRAFCSVRPPGHHALADRAMGFCLFANVAVGAQSALNSGQAKRVAILDWDVHHGNGTQDIFWERGDVLYASLHQYPAYPGTGAAGEIGAGDGQGLTVNCPIAAGEGDEAFAQAWEDRVRPAFEEFGPDLVMISAGFDADYRDPLGALTVTPKGFTALSEAVVRWADANCQGRVVSVLEGGYALPALSEDVSLHVETML